MLIYSFVGWYRYLGDILSKWSEIIFKISYQDRGNVIHIKDKTDNQLVRSTMSESCLNRPHFFNV